MQRYLLGDISEATEQQEEAIALFESVGAERSALRRAELARATALAARRQAGVAAADRSRDRRASSDLGPSPELAMAYSFRSQSVMLEPDFEAGEKWARKAIEIAEQTDGTAALVHAYNNLGACLMWKGDLEGVEYLRRSLAIGARAPPPRRRRSRLREPERAGQPLFPVCLRGVGGAAHRVVEYSARTIPDGVFDRWLRSGWGEFLLVTGRWAESEPVIFGIDPDAAEAYLGSEVRSLRAHFLAWTGQPDEARRLATLAAETSERMGDIQAVLPPLAALAAAQAGLGEDAAAVASIEHGIELRGTRNEPTMSAWYLFEVVDTLSTIASRDPSSAALRDGL